MAALTHDDGMALPDEPEAAVTRKPLWRWLRRVVSLALVVAGCVVAYSKRGEIDQAVDRIGQPAWGWLVAACVAQMSSMIVFARLQRWLLRSGGVRVRLRDMVEITLAGNAMSTSLPGGAAWAAGWVWGQLRRRQVDRVLAGWVVLVAGAVSSFALFLLVVIGAFLAGDHGPVQSLRWVGLALLGVGVLAATAVFATLRSDALSERWRARVADADGAPGKQAALVRGIDGFAHRVVTVRPSPLGWLEALALATYNWVADLLTLIFVILALHGHVPWGGIVVTYALTQISASVPITPGGLAVVEASLTALLTAYGLSTDSAITTVLVYRVISFWALVPIGWGSWGWLELRQHRGSHPRRAHPWAEHRQARRARLDAKRGPERLIEPKVCEDCPDPASSGLSHGPPVEQGSRPA